LRGTEYNLSWPAALRFAASSVWIYAGVIKKLLDPGFLNPSSTSYVGLTVQYLAQGPLLRPFLYAAVFPHVMLVGFLVMVGEVSFAILTMLGLLNRLTGTVALYTNLVYLLSAYWAGAEEYGVNLFLIIADLLLVLGAQDPLSLDSLLSRKLRLLRRPLPWFVAGTSIYSAIIVYLLLS
jgi:thiosulfate dehydrogenase [quinone] large subunit